MSAKKTWRRFARFQALIAELPPTWREVLERRARGKSLRVIGREMGLSGERIRQLEIKANRRLAGLMRRGDLEELPAYEPPPVPKLRNHDMTPPLREHTGWAS